jgi:hypothetical protein
MARKKKLIIPENCPNVAAISNAARRERVKQYILKGGFTVQEMADEEGVFIKVINCDIQFLKNQDILKDVKEATRLAFLDYSGRVDWAVDEATRMHEEKIDDEGHGGRLDCLNFVATKKKEEIEVAQKLGLLDIAAEKKDHVHHIKVDDPELIKKFGDFIATESDS